MRNVIYLKDHPSNLDRRAVLVSGGHYTGRDIYRVSGGFLAVIGPECCFNGLFATQDDAATALADYGRPKN